MSDSITMSSEDLRIKEVPSIKDLEKIEAYNDGDSLEEESFQRFVQSELLKRFVEEDDRYDDTWENLGASEFDYGDVRGGLRNGSGKIIGRVFRPGDRDMSDRDLGKIGGAARGNTLHTKAMKTYQSALEKAGYDLNDPTEEDLVEAAEQALEEIDHEDFRVDIEGTTRAAYEEAVQFIEEYRLGNGEEIIE